jgi:hypothetical protein
LKQLQNIERWKPSAGHKAKIYVSTGYKPMLQLSVYKYVPKDRRLLDHFIWRNGCEEATTRTASPPWGLQREETLERQEINVFIDAMIDELLNEDSFRRKDKIWTHVFHFAYSLSKDEAEKDVSKQTSDNGATANSKSHDC